jgi:catechol 2,3-dioxygenase-like lactoylglutathione lyase family enzyme
MASIAAAAPQLLVDDLERSLAFYEGRLGFAREFTYGDFYPDVACDGAGVARDGAVIQLKCAPKLPAERAHRAAGEHLDAYLIVTGIRELHDEFMRRGAPVVKPLEERPWGMLDFYVEDPDGYLLCFSESL